MLAGDGKSALVMQNETQNVWAVGYGSQQWAGWVNWYHYEIGKNSFPKWLTVPTEWPPTTEEAAASVAKWLSDIRDGKFGKDIFPCSRIPVRARPSPWSGAKSIPPSPPCSYPGLDFGENPPWQKSRMQPRATLPPPEQFT
jgi:hypothetical protein